MQYHSLKEVFDRLLFQYRDLLKTAEARGISVWDKKQELTGLESDARILLQATTPPSPEPSMVESIGDDLGQVDIGDEEVTQRGDTDDDKGNTRIRGKRAS